MMAIGTPLLILLFSKDIVILSLLFYILYDHELAVNPVSLGVAFLNASTPFAPYESKLMFLAQFPDFLSISSVLLKFPFETILIKVHHPFVFNCFFLAEFNAALDFITSAIGFFLAG